MGWRKGEEKKRKEKKTAVVTSKSLTCNQHPKSHRSPVTDARRGRFSVYSNPVYSNEQKKHVFLFDSGFFRWFFFFSLTFEFHVSIAPT